MTLENYDSLQQTDHRLPIASFNLLDENDMKKYFNWINLSPMYSTENNSQKAKIDPYLYKPQEITAKKNFIYLTERDLMKIFIDEIFSKPPRKIMKPMK